MANRNDWDVRQHETLPGPGPSPSPALNGIRPVEQMVDAAIDRLAREQACTPTPTSEPAYPLAKPMKPTRLRWKGLEVSDEFKAYAERVARGEDLPPFQGRVLAEPNAAFPWGMSALPEPPPRASGAPRTALLGTAVLMVGLLGWSIAMKLETAPPDLPYGASSAGMDPIADHSLDPPEPLVEPSAAAPLDTADGELPRRDLPHDVVDPSSVGTIAQPAVEPPPTATTENAGALAVEPAPAPASAGPAAQPSAVSPGGVTPAPPSPTAAGASPVAAPAANAPSPAPVRPASAVPAPASAVPAPPTRPAEPARVPPKAIEEDFGLDELPPPAPSAPKAATAGANGGDAARGAPGSGSSVRKEPGSESSAKGSLLIENPSF